MSTKKLPSLTKLNEKVYSITNLSVASLGSAGDAAKLGENKLSGATGSLFSLRKSKGESKSAIPPQPPTLQSKIIDVVTLPLTIFVSLFVYCPFCVAVVFQSAVTRRAVDTDNYKNEMKPWAWCVGLFVFFALLVYPAGVSTVMERLLDRGWRVGVVVAVFLVMIGAVQVLTILYAFLKPGLGMVSIPAESRINLFHWRNTLPLLAPIIEFIQFTSFAFRTSTDTWLCTSSLGVAVRAFVRIASFRFQDVSCEGTYEMHGPSLFYAATSSAFAVCCLYAILLGYAIAKFLQPGHWLCTLVFELFAGIAYLPVVSKLLSVLDCRTKISETGQRNMYLYYAEPDTPSIEVPCWTGEHEKYGAMAFAGLLIFGLSAIFVGSYKADKLIRRSSVTFIPRIVVIKRTINSAFLAVNLLIGYTSTSRTTYTHGTQATGLLTLCTFLFLDLYYNSCTFHKLRILTFGAHLAALWSYISTIVADRDGLEDWVPHVTLFVGWGVIGMGVCGWLLVGWWQKKKSKHQEMQGKLKKADVNEETLNVFKVVTMRRRVKVAIGGECEDEDEVIARAIYGPGEKRRAIPNGALVLVPPTEEMASA
ncbi:hypothetical protein SpCBS45565_g05275 [Spizellomyces sp. 'palustris']|nr:hypothetical protein SpCBS45565_g05275 [Spizellomyces sp. 'palustris']